MTRPDKSRVVPIVSVSHPVERARTASHASLRYVCCAEPGIRRIRKGKGFVSVLPNGRRLTSSSELERIRKLALPPAWRDVWICTSVTWSRCSKL